ncbi:MAG: DUF2017 family protein [Terrimicrobiaceae bacterium]
MTFFRTSEGTLAIREIPEPFLEMLKAIPLWNESSGPEAEARIFPPPSINDDGLVNDWKAFVQPELYDQFMDSRNTVQADLGAITGDPGNFALDIPIRHAPAWLNALNQARLAIAATYDFTDKELSKPAPAKLTTARQIARLEMDFFAAIQEWILDAIESASPQEGEDPPEDD